MFGSRRLLLATMVWLGLTSSAIASTPEAPVHGSIGLVASPLGFFRFGVEGEIAMSSIPLHFGGVAWMPVYGSGWAQTLWGGYSFRPRAQDRLTVLAGATHYIQGGIDCIDTCPPLGEYGLVVGLSYLVREERLWMKVTPQYMFPLGGPYAYPTWALSGLPWVEVGMAVAPNCDVSVRLGETLFKVAYRL